ncbi:MAG: hypothetical protein ACP5JE_05915, partial [Thermoplasmata archaeon]
GTYKYSNPLTNTNSEALAVFKVYKKPVDLSDTVKNVVFVGAIKNIDIYYQSIHCEAKNPALFVKFADDDQND